MSVQAQQIVTMFRCNRPFAVIRDGTEELDSVLPQYAGNGAAFQKTPHPVDCQRELIPRGVAVTALAVVRGNASCDKAVLPVNRSAADHSFRDLCGENGIFPSAEPYQVKQNTAVQGAVLHTGAPSARIWKTGGNFLGRRKMIETVIRIMACHIVVNHPCSGMEQNIMNLPPCTFQTLLIERFAVFHIAVPCFSSVEIL